MSNPLTTAAIAAAVTLAINAILPARPPIDPMPLALPIARVAVPQHAGVKHARSVRNLSSATGECPPPATSDGRLDGKHQASLACSQVYTRHDADRPVSVKRRRVTLSSDAQTETAIQPPPPPISGAETTGDGQFQHALQAIHDAKHWIRQSATSSQLHTIINALTDQQLRRLLTSSVMEFPHLVNVVHSLQQQSTTPILATAASASASSSVAPSSATNVTEQLAPS